MPHLASWSRINDQPSWHEIRRRGSLTVAPSTSYLLHGEWTGPLAVELSDSPGRYRLKDEFSLSCTPLAAPMLTWVREWWVASPVNSPRLALSIEASRRQTLYTTHYKILASPSTVLCGCTTDLTEGFVIERYGSR